MKIIGWNCQMKFREKAKHLNIFNSDVVVICECENLEKLKFGMDSKIPTDQLWFGDNPSKGIGIFSYSDYKIKLHSSYNPAFRYVVPIEVNGSEEFNLLAIWAMPDKEKYKHCSQSLFDALNYYRDFLSSKPTILIGDFNSNVIWDKDIYEKTFAQGIEFLKQKNIVSCYHEIFKENFGEEQIHTHIWRKSIKTTYHIDYCFASKKLVEKITEFKVGTFDEWSKISDHSPLFVEIKS
jgi:exonuclease III